jgi:hypothetical protein
LELIAAALSAKIADKIKKELSSKISETDLWTDSTIALNNLNMSEPLKVEMWKFGSKLLWKKEEHWPKEPPGLSQFPEYYDHFKAEIETGGNVVLAHKVQYCTSTTTNINTSTGIPNTGTPIRQNPIKTLHSHFSKWTPFCKSVAWLLRLQQVIRQKRAGKPLRVLLFVQK